MNEEETPKVTITETQGEIKEETQEKVQEETKEEIQTIRNLKLNPKEKGKKYKLMRIATIGLTAVGLLTTALILQKITEIPELKNTDNIEGYLEQGEFPIAEQLAKYSICLDDFEQAKKSKNEKSEVESRVELIKETRNLVTSSDLLIKEKIKEALNLTGNETVNVLIRREMDTKNGPTNYIIVKNQEEETYRFDDLPTEINRILNSQEKINIYNGTGENSVWKKEIDNFIKEGNELYNKTVELIEKDFTFEDGNLKTTKENKTI